MKTISCLLAFAFVCAAQPQSQPAKIPDNVTVESNIAYGPHKETVLDVFQPKGTAVGKRCGVLAIHGGGWMGGTKESVVERFVLPFTEKGCVVANVEYRLGKVAPAPAAVQDVLEAAEWFRDNAKRYNVDTKRIVAIGGSAGGHLALMVGMTPKGAKLGPTGKIAAVINFFGITDVEDQLQGPNMKQYAVEWIGSQQKERFEVARHVSPMSYIRKDVPAILTIHGNADETVPYEHGVQLTKALRDEGADAEMISIPNGGHGFPPEQLHKQIYPQIFEFLRKREIIK